MPYFCIMYKVLVPLATYHMPPGTQAPLHFARLTYINQLVRRGLYPLFVSVGMSPEMIAQAYADASGVLLMGGGDMDARTYGQANHAFNDHTELGRDILEVALARLAYDDRKPILGVCRGAQVMAVASGGSLHQHLPDLNVAEEHGIGEGNGYDHLSIGGGHPVVLRQGTRILDMLGADTVTINSGHHQAVAGVGPELVISGVTAGGIVEFIEHRDKTYFCLGVQGHPEVGGKVARAIFDCFARACVLA